MKPICGNCGSTKLVKKGLRRGQQRYNCKACGKPDVAVANRAELDDRGIDPARSKAIAAEVKAAHGTVQRYVITAAQNATPVYTAGWRSLLSYAAKNDAQIMVIPIRYKNPTSWWSQRAKSHDWWAEELQPYLTGERIELGDHLVVMGDVAVQPTARRPLEGFETISGSRSAIFGHPKLELSTVATPQQRLPKILTTTGAITRKNYIRGKAGKMGEFHHTFGAALVEITESGGFHLRQLNITKSGSFIDLDREYHPDGTVNHTSAAALVMGDWHQRFNDPAVREATFGKGGIVDTLKPKTVVWHDVFDGFSRNPHDWRDPVRNYVKQKYTLGNVGSELKQTYDAIDAVTSKERVNVFTFSNHNDFLNRWVKRVRGAPMDPENELFWAESYKQMLAAAEWTKNGVKEIDLFEYWARAWLKSYKQGVFLGPDDSYTVKGIELAMHGHLGANGAEGSLQSFAKIGVKSITGHSHSPGIRDGAYRTGTSGFLRVDYNRGLSSWLQTHAVVYANGKRALINIIDGKWRAT